MPIANFYLGAASNAAAPAPFQRPQSMSQVSLQRAPQGMPSSPPANASTTPSNRASMPPPRRQPVNEDIASEADTSNFVNQHAAPSPKPAPVPEDPEAEQEAMSPKSSKRTPLSGAARRQRNGTMDRNFKFPSPSSTSPTESPPPVPSLSSDANIPKAGSENPQSPSSVPMEVPPPDPVEKERERVDSNEVDDDIGATEEISLN